MKRAVQKIIVSQYVALFLVKRSRKSALSAQ